MNRRAFLSIPFRSDPAPEFEADLHETGFPVIPTAGFPREYARHTLVLVKDVHAWLGRDDVGFYAVEAGCPHLGCMVQPTGTGFVCPCHNSRFSAAGDVISGPARSHLSYLLVDLDSNGKLIIRRDQIVSPDDRFIA